MEVVLSRLDASVAHTFAQCNHLLVCIVAPLVPNYLYEKFEVATEFVPGKSLVFKEFNEAITTAISQGGSNPYCPKGYRTPNQREMAIMAYNKLYDGTEFNYYNGSYQNMMSRTAFSFGHYGLQTVDTKYGYGYYSNIITLYNTMKASTTRCVKDIRVD